MPIENFSGKAISDTYQRVVQTDGTYLADGTGSILNILNITASYALNASGSGGDSFPYTGSAIITGSLEVIGPFTASSAIISGNVQVLGTASINTLVVNQTQLSTGSNQLGDAVNDTQTLFGTVRIPTGSFTVTGSASIISGSLTVTADSSLSSRAILIEPSSVGTAVVRHNRSNTTSIATYEFLTGGFLKWAIGLRELGDDNYHIYNQGTGTDAITIKRDNGFVGIGFSTPSASLDVSGSGRFTSGLLVTGSITSSQDIQINSITIGRGKGNQEYNTAVGYLALSSLTPGGSLGERNTAMGWGALQYLTTGVGNVAIGMQSGTITSVGSANVFIGRQSGDSNISGSTNVYIGNNAGGGSQDNSQNTYVGNAAGYSAANTPGSSSYFGFLAGHGTTGGDNVFIGHSAGFLSTKSNWFILGNRNNDGLIVGDFSTGNVMIGTSATSSFKLNVSGSGNFASNLTVTGSITSSQNIVVNNINIGRGGTSGSVMSGWNIAIGEGNFNTSSVSLNRRNIAIGGDALRDLTTGFENIAIGNSALKFSSTTTGNIGIGQDALLLNTNGNYNTSVGYQSMQSNTNGETNSAFGYQALKANINGNSNTAVGNAALQGNQFGRRNTAVGDGALGILTQATSSNNTALGYSAGVLIYSGSYNTIVGSDSSPFETGSNNTVLGGRLSTTSITSSKILNNSVIIADGVGSVRFYSPSSSNVLIGTFTDTGQKLQVSGSARITNGLLVTGSINLSGSFTSNQDITVNGLTIGKGVGSDFYSIVIGRANFSSSYSGYANIAIGDVAGGNNTSGDDNIYIGLENGLANRTGNGNIIMGSEALRNGNSLGYGNIAIGDRAARGANFGDENVALGAYALNNILGGNSNTALGSYALQNINTTGSFNTGLGYWTGKDFNSGSYNIFIGNDFKGLRSGSFNTIIGGSIPLGTLTDGSSRNLVLADGSGSIRLYSPSSTNVIIGGTTDLGYKLQVSGSGNFNNNLTTSGSFTAGVSSIGRYWLPTNLFDTGSANNGLTVRGDLVVAHTNNLSQLVFGYTNSTKYLYVGTDGIGPYFKGTTVLDIRVVNGADVGLYVKSDNTAFFNSSNVSINGTTGLGEKTLQVNGSGRFTNTLSITGSTDIRGAGSTSSTYGLNVVNASGTSSLYVRDDGNVGIGTTTPSYKLDVGGTMRISSGTTASALLVESSGINTSITLRSNSPGYGNAILYYTNAQLNGQFRVDGNGSFGIEARQNIDFNYFGGNGDVNFWRGTTIGGGGPVGIQSVFKNNGNVLIGTSTDPGYKLHVSGSGNFVMGLTVTGSITASADSYFNTIRVGLGNNNVYRNTAIGVETLQSVSGDENTVVGYRAGQFLSTGARNIAIGTNSGNGLQSGTDNVILAINGATYLGAGSRNIILGVGANFNPSGNNNIAIGYQALHGGAGGHSNSVAIGYRALYATSAGNNVAVGYEAGIANGGSSNMAALGYQALSGSTGANNTALGSSAGFNNTSGANNIFIGYLATGSSATESNRTWIGNSSTTSTWLAGKVLIGTRNTSSAILDIYKSGSTVVDVQGSQGQLFSITDSLTGSLMSVNDVSGLPILEVSSDDKVVMGTYGAVALTVTGSRVGVYTTTPSASLHVSGAFLGYPVTVPTASGTASLDCSRGNFFNLTLSSSFTLFLSASNIQPGQTINLRVTQPATSGSLTYGSQFKFAGGIPYTASATGSAVDIISFITFDTTNLYGSAIKNLS